MATEESDVVLGAGGAGDDKAKDSAALDIIREFNEKRPHAVF